MAQRIAVWTHLSMQRLNPENLTRLWSDDCTENNTEIFLDEDTKNHYMKYNEGTSRGYEEKWYILQR